MASKDYLPHYAAGKIVSGFGRGSKALGCPTGMRTIFQINFSSNLFTFAQRYTFYGMYVFKSIEVLK